MPSDTELLEHLYDRFNARDLEAVLATMHLGDMFIVAPSAGPPARLCSDRDELMQLDPANRAHGAALEVVEHEQADRRRQVALLAGCVDLTNQLSHCARGKSPSCCSRTPLRG